MNILYFDYICCFKQNPDTNIPLTELEERVIYFKNKNKMSYQDALATMATDKTLTAKQIEEVNYNNVSVRCNEVKRCLIRLASFSRSEAFFMKKLASRMDSCSVFEIKKLSNLKKFSFNGTNELPLAIGIVLDRLDNRIFNDCTDIDVLFVHELDKKLTTRAIFLDKYEYGPTMEFIDNLMEFSCEVVNPAMEVKPQIKCKNETFIF